MNNILRQLREQKGSTLKAVAKYIGVSTSAYSNYEQGIRQPGIEIIKKLCEYFEVSADYLLGIKTDEQPIIKTTTINNSFNGNNNNVNI